VLYVCIGYVLCNFIILINTLETNFYMCLLLLRSPIFHLKVKEESQLYFQGSIFIYVVICVFCFIFTYFIINHSLPYRSNWKRVLSSLMTLKLKLFLFKSYEGKSVYSVEILIFSADCSILSIVRWLSSFRLPMHLLIFSACLSICMYMK
jgi:hypothetical protein